MDTLENGGRVKCEEERAAGQVATACTKAKIDAAGVVVVRDPAWGRWGGRVAAELMGDGRSLAEALIAAGHGRAYGSGKRER